MTTNLITTTIGKPVTYKAPKLITSGTDTKTTDKNGKPEILFITSYPPRECGIATFSQDMISALNNKFNKNFKSSICAVENGEEAFVYDSKVKYIFKANLTASYAKLARIINIDTNIDLVVIQHEFGFFDKHKIEFSEMMAAITKPKIIVFHTVLPKPNAILLKHVAELSAMVKSIIVMTNAAADLLMKDYGIAKNKIAVIPHGTHLVAHLDKDILKSKFNLDNKLVLSTFGLLSSGKNIETTLKALPNIILKYPNVVFLIIGKTHPSVVKQDGEQYREGLLQIIAELKLEHNVQFINNFLALPELLEYLQLTDVYLFTSKDPNQAVSGTFSFAVACGCPIISTPIPHAVEVLKDDAGIVVDFENPTQLEHAIFELLDNENHRKDISSNGLHRIAATAWENSALAHTKLFTEVTHLNFTSQYNAPDLNLNHLKKLTTDFGIVQFSKIYEPDIESGYTLDDNARALIAICQNYELFGNESDLALVNIYLNFIKYCLLEEGYFLNYVDKHKKFTSQNYITNLADANGRAIWALGFLVSLSGIMPAPFVKTAINILESITSGISKIYSTRAMAFVIKGLYFKSLTHPSANDLAIIKLLADRFVQMYKHEKSEEWQWFESYFTYANSILPEALLYAFLATGERSYCDISKLTFDFLLTKIFRKEGINVISNKTWLHKSKMNEGYPIGGEQPIDVAYTIIALDKFYDVFEDDTYKHKMFNAFNWFHGKNHLNKIIYNPCTGGCYDGLEEHYVNLNQGAESTLSYLMARLTIEQYMNTSWSADKQLEPANNRFVNMVIM